MLYLWLKLFHIVSSTILFGTGIGTASILLYGYYTKDIKVIASITRYVVLADWIFTSTAVVLQLLTGLALIWVGGYALSNLWIWGGLAGYFLAGACWLPVVYIQYQMRDLAINAAHTNSPLPSRFHALFRVWFLLGWPAFISLSVVFYLMVMKPI